MAQYALNCFLLFLPVFVFNAVYYGKLPAFFRNETWDNIPKALNATENVLRYLSFFVPIFFRIRLDTPAGRVGIALYFVGICAYFASWMFQLRFGENGFAKSLPFRAAPAYTTVAWLAGIALLGESRFLSVPIVRLAYLAIAFGFVCAHTAHACLAHKKQIASDCA